MPKELFTVVFYDHDDSLDYYWGSASQILEYMKLKGITEEYLIVRGEPVGLMALTMAAKK